MADVLVLKLSVKSAFCNWMVKSIFPQEVEIAMSLAKYKLLSVHLISPHALSSWICASKLNSWRKKKKISYEWWFSVGYSSEILFLFQLSGISCRWYVIQEVLWFTVSPEGYAIMVPKWKSALTVLFCPWTICMIPTVSHFINSELRLYCSESPTKANRVCCY